MESLLATAGWKATLSSRPGQEAALYARIKDEEAWKDFNYRMGQLREATRNALERGQLDAYGKTHEPEQRSVMYVLDHLLTYVPALEEDFKRYLAQMAEQENLAGRPIYGNDVIASLTDIL